MEFVYFKSKKGNFGDDLNPWLWSQIFPITNINNDVNFVGIGTILSPFNKEVNVLRGKKTLFFGTGIRPNVANNFIVDEKWDIRFLRGPLSSYVLQNKYPYIADSAYAVRQTEIFHKIYNSQKKYKISLMPYFFSTKYLDWKKICRKLGYHYISPHSEKGVDFTLSEIAASELLITEAMHGAILADAFRVPWKRYVFSTSHIEGEYISEFKWNDWLYSINVFNSKPIVIPQYKKTYLGYGIEFLTLGRICPKFFMKFKAKKRILEMLDDVGDYYLSSGLVLDKIDESMKNEISKIKSEYF